MFEKPTEKLLYGKYLYKIVVNTKKSLTKNNTTEKHTLVDDIKKDFEILKISEYKITCSEIAKQIKIGVYVNYYKISIYFSSSHAYDFFTLKHKHIIKEKSYIINEQHQQKLYSTKRIIVREQLYFLKYKYKVVFCKIDEDVIEFLKTLDGVYKISNIKNNILQKLYGVSGTTSLYLTDEEDYVKLLITFDDSYIKHNFMVITNDEFR